jgi:HlyD family secretion protein
MGAIEHFKIKSQLMPDKSFVLRPDPIKDSAPIIEKIESDNAYQPTDVVSELSSMVETRSFQQSRFAQKQLITGAVVITVMAGSWFLLNRFTGDEIVEQSAIPAIPVSTQIIALREITGAQLLTGTLEPIQIVTTTSRVVGKIINLPFKEGDQVQTGQVLAKIDVKDITAQRNQATAAIAQAQAGIAVSQSTQIQAIAGANQVAAQLQQAQAQLQQAEAQSQQAQSQFQQAQAQHRNAIAQKQSVQIELANAQLTQRRRAMLQKAGAIGQSSLDEANTQVAIFQSRLQQTIASIDQASEGTNQAKAGIAQAKAGISQAKAGIERFQAALAQSQAGITQAQAGVTQAHAQVEQATESKSQVIANIDYGVVTAPFNGVVIRKHTEIGAIAGVGQSIITLENTSKQRFSVDVPESLIPQIKQGYEVTIYLDALKKNVSGTIDRIIPSANPNSHSVNVKIALPTNPELMSGMFGRLELPGSIRKGIVVPSSAIIRRGQLEGIYVLSRSNQSILRWIKMGKSQQGNNVEITSGLSVGDRVITSKINQLTDGRAVVVNR